MQKETYHRESLPGVSIVIAVKNGARRLRLTLQSLVRQDYPQYEIIIVDDYSEPKEQNDLETLVMRLPDVFLFRSDRAPGKKHALSMGVEKANHPFILCTDADCIPAGPRWIKTMMNRSNGHDMVLGYSPYFKKAGRLNPFIRFETVMTGIQYLSWTMLGYPYMGVGRNMLYPKEAFTKSDPYKHSKDVPYGDDDLFVQAAKKHVPVNVSLHPDSFVYSEPASTVGEWISQKHRHLSAGRYYSVSAWLQPGIFGVAVNLHWLLLFPMMWYQVSVEFDLAFFAGLFVRWFGYASWTKRLGDEDTKWFYPWYEIGFAFYLAVMGVITIVEKRKTWN
jgi:poly-beta-1,6-N-acetyl-D-glucosamine synthase